MVMALPLAAVLEMDLKVLVVRKEGVGIRRLME